MSERTWNRALVLTAIAVAAISCASVWLAWRASPDLASRLGSLALVPILLAALVSYSLRAVRFHYFLTRSRVDISFRGTVVVQAVGFALSVTPGHIGEVFKLHLIRERSGAPVVRTAPLLLLDRVTEGGGFMILALGSALALPALRSHLPSTTSTLAGLAVIALAGIAAGRGRERLAPALRWVEGKAFWKRIAPHAENLWRGLEASFTPRQILGGLALSAVARFADGLVLLFAARLFGMDLALPVAVFVLAVSGLAGGISLLPAGAGAVETTMAGLLVLSGAPLSTALAITVVARLATLWMWVALGLILAFALQITAHRPTLISTTAPEEIAQPARE